MKNLSTYKKEAKTFQKQHSIKLHQAQLLIAQKYNFVTWPELVHACKNHVVTSIPTPVIDEAFFNAEDVINTESTEKSYSKVNEERKSDLADNIKQRIYNNRRRLVATGNDFAIFEPTSTGLKKSILDATQSIRTLFKEAGFHNYESQGQGQEHKIVKDAVFLTANGNTNTTVSLYRPNTKSGDPRMWFKGLPAFADAGSQVSIQVINDSLVLINLSAINLVKETAPLHTDKRVKPSVQEGSNVINNLLSLSSNDNPIAHELLTKLKALARQGLIRATTKGSTAIGMSIEHALGIPANSSKQPDYKGIELKSGRNSKNRTTLFAQVANWKESPLKSSAEILDQFGYMREEDLKLYCTISSRKPNSQGLQFSYDDKNDLLVETQTNFGDVVSWSGKLLRSRLLEKHKETFWIYAKSTFIEDIEYFELISVTHTRNPMCHQLLPLIRDGVVTMDHLIKRRAIDGRVAEKGPLFKINKKDLPLLFPEPVTYSLQYNDKSVVINSSCSLN